MSSLRNELSAETTATGWWDPVHAAWIADLVDEQQGAERRVAAFDADGTVWSGDIGEALLLELEAEGGLAGFEDADIGAAWRRYEELQEDNPTRAYAFCAEALSGWSERALAARCARLAEAFVPSHVFPAMLRLIERLMAHGVEVWLVSASNRWIVEAAAAQVGIPAERVIAMATTVEDGVVTDRLVQPATNLDGKVGGLDERVGVRPFLAAGNSVSDVPMLRCATGGALVINPTEDLYGLAVKRGWVVRMLGQAASPVP